MLVAGGGEDVVVRVDVVVVRSSPTRDWWAGPGSRLQTFLRRGWAAWSGAKRADAGSISLATTPEGGQSEARPRASARTGKYLAPDSRTHAARPVLSARMCPSRSP